MNEHDIETLLSGLQPQGPSEVLSHAVARELEQDRQWMLTPVRRRRQTWLTPVLWSSVGAAAAVLVMSVWSGPESVTAPVSVASLSSPSVLPVTTIREVVGTQNEGIQYNEDSQMPEQHMKVVTMERHAWIDPRDGAHITLERPREDSVILPVSFQ